MHYRVYVNVSITPEINQPSSGYAPSSNLSYAKSFTVTADSFSELAPRVDAVMGAAEHAADIFDNTEQDQAAADEAAAAQDYHETGGNPRRFDEHAWHERTAQLRAGGFTHEADARDNFFKTMPRG